MFDLLRFPRLYGAKLACERDYIGLAGVPLIQQWMGDLGIQTEKVS